MHFIDEQNSVTPALLEGVFGHLHGITYVLDACQHGRYRDEFGVECLCHQAGQRRFADAGGAPQDHRMRLAGFEREPQGFAGPK